MPLYEPNPIITGPKHWTLDLYKSIQCLTSVAVLKDSRGSYILNGDFVVTVYSKEFQVGGVKVYYSGSTDSVERINATKMIREDLEVLVGNGDVQDAVTLKACMWPVPDL